MVEMHPDVEVLQDRTSSERIIKDEEMKQETS